MSDPAVLDRDGRLARLLAELTDQLHHGQTPNLESVTSQHPDLAVELRELWGTVLFTEALAPPAEQPTLPLPPASTPPGPPARTLDDYDLLEPIGQGGMGVVYKARQRSANRIVALKTMRGDRTTAEDRARFKIEAEASARLDHSHIVPVYDVGECDSQLYFSMKLIEGQTLSKLVAAGPLPPREAARLVAAIADAVHYAHEQGILHRDLKPSNVLIDAKGEPHVTDFGLAKRVGAPDAIAPETRLTATNAILGTLSYMPPEQTDGRRHQPDRTGDVYSLGAILYELLTGRPPFLASNPIDLLLQIREHDPVAPRRLNPNIDRDLELICLKCLQKPPELRYATAKQLGDDLNAFLHGERPSVWSGNLKYVASSLFRETHHAPVLENWGTLWMWHSLIIFLLCALTNVLMRWRVDDPWTYLALWGGGLIVWGIIFWSLRKRGGPVQFIERQIAHVWGSAIIATIGVFVVELLLGYPPLTLTPLLAVIAGMVFVVKAGMLTGSFYFSAAAMFLSAIPMALYPQVAPLIFGAVTAVCFFVPGFKYHRQRARRRAWGDGIKIAES
jgi:tRNA A-37 threonylcarbamoyl transferase component Bud32